jgi:hypothetical protein
VGVVVVAGFTRATSIVERLVKAHLRREAPVAGEEGEART